MGEIQKEDGDEDKYVKGRRWYKKEKRRKKQKGEKVT